jgi:predicted methyltransferase
MFRNVIACAVIASCATFGAASAQNVPAYITAAVNAADRPAADKMRDADRHPAETLAFSTVKPGDQVFELVGAGGYYTRLLSTIVGPMGKVTVTVPETQLQARPESAAPLKNLALEPGHWNVVVLAQPVGTPQMQAGVLADVVWTTLNYHDFHNPGMFSAGDMALFNKYVFDALKPGGVFLVVDHVAAPGSGFSATQSLHRIDPEAVKAEITKAGFVFDGESKVLARPNDPHTARSDDKSDQFIFRFRKPAAPAR